MSNMAGMWIVGEDMPQETNRITLSDAEGPMGPAASRTCNFDDHPNDVAMRDHAYRQGAALYDAVGRDAHLPDAALSLDP